MDDKKVFFDYIKPVSDKTFERLYAGARNSNKFFEANSVTALDVTIPGFVRRIKQANKAKKIHKQTMKEFVRNMK